MSGLRRGLVTGVMAGVALVLAACGSTTSTPIYTSPSPSAVETPSAAASPSAAAGYTVPFTAEGPGAGAVSGTLTVTPGDGSFTVVVTLAGLAASSAHPSHIHAGATCDANGPIDIALQTVTADASGNATTTSVIPQAYVLPATGWYVNVHQGPDLIGANATPIACAVMQ